MTNFGGVAEVTGRDAEIDSHVWPESTIKHCIYSA